MMHSDIPWRVEPLLLTAALVFFVLWLALSALVIVNRLLHDRRKRRREPYVAGSRPADRLLRDASPRARKWRRVPALFALAKFHPARAHTPLETALHDTDPDIASAAAVNLHRLGDERAAGILIEALRPLPDALPPSRVAMHLDQFPIPIGELLRPLLTDVDRDRRYWGASLLYRYPDLDGIALDLAPLARDEHAPVRKAALVTLGGLNPDVCLPVARRALDDPVPYVRSAAARALAAQGAREPDVARRRTLAATITPLLGDQAWDVRLAAKEALVQLGPGVWHEVASALHAPDGFSRNGAAEVLQNLGIVDWTLQGLAHGVNLSPELREALTSALREGGPAFVASAALREPEAVPELERLVPSREFTEVKS